MNHHSLIVNRELRGFQCALGRAFACFEALDIEEFRVFAKHACVELERLHASCNGSGDQAWQLENSLPPLLYRLGT